MTVDIVQCEERRSGQIPPPGRVGKGEEGRRRLLTNPTKLTVSQCDSRLMTTPQLQSRIETWSKTIAPELGLCRPFVDHQWPLWYSDHGDHWNELAAVGKVAVNAASKWYR